MSEYDVEQVRKFAQDYKEQIEQAKKNYPEIGGLIEDILKSIIEEEPKKQPTTVTPKPEKAINIDGVYWLPLASAQPIKEMVLSNNLYEKARRTGEWILNSPTKTLFTDDQYLVAINGMLLTGDLYQLETSPDNIESYERVYKYKYSFEKKSILFKFNEDYAKFFDIRSVIIDFEKDKDLQFMVQYFTQELIGFVGKKDAEKYKLMNEVTNTTIYKFLENEGANGFYNEDSKKWQIPSELTKSQVAIENSFLKTVQIISAENLNTTLGTKLIPARKPKFNALDEVYIKKNTTNGLIGFYKYDPEKKTYIYLIEPPSKQSFYANEDEITLATPTQKTPPTPKKATVRKPKAPAPTPISSEEKEIREMTQLELQQLKTDIQETLPYLDEGDAEKKELEIQLELVNLYLEN